MEMELSWFHSSSYLFTIYLAVILLLQGFNMQLHPGTHALGSTFFNSAEGNITDRQALLEFKNKITSDHFGVMLSWNNTVHHCEWHGVSCGHLHGRVTKLELKSLKLKGSISPYIGNLSFLRVLDLRNNSLGLGIPGEIGGLRRLEILKLGNNSFGGGIPSNISSCSKLRNLDAAFNQLVGEIPSVLGHLSNLQLLQLQKNNLRGSIPHSLGNMSSLQILNTCVNEFISGTIPEALGKLNNLEILSVCMSRISGIVPPSIYNLSKIRVFDISSNQIHGTLPSDLGTIMPHLEYFDVTENQLSGSLPYSISNNSNLTSFQAGLNQFTGNLPSFHKLNKLESFAIGGNFLGNGGAADDLNFLCSLTNASNLYVLYMSGNNLGGALPECISKLSTNLALFMSEGNLISGRIPAGIGNLINLQMLYLDLNLLTGHIPSAIGRLIRLQEIYLQDNYLSGAIPPALGNLTMLNLLNLSDNNLHGSIPSSLGKCENLALLDLSNNNLSGSIPIEVVGLSSLSMSLDLSSNHLTGVLPVEIGSLLNLGQLSVSHNKLSGALPSTLSSCVMLEKLSMAGNFFHGPIPLSLSSLTGLAKLDISHNNLSGVIPEFFKNFKSLKYLNLSYNDFEGVLPTDGVFKNANALSIEGNTKLCGGIPEFHLPICNFRKPRRSLYKVVIAIIFGVLGIVLLVSFVLTFLYRKKTTSPPSTCEQALLLNLSYRSLFNATDGFSSSNLVGSGSFGSVYKGILEMDGSVVAVKVLNLFNHAASRSFVAECETLRNIRHRNLVKVITACSSVDYHGNDFKALVYEFMVNGSLEDWLHPSVDADMPSKSMSFSQRLNVAIDVACAMDYLHHHCEIPIVHRDLKPSNILLDEEMVSHVGDFGLAKYISADVQNHSTRHQSSNLGFGTIGYAPPEYGLGSEVSTFGDVYSYGIVLLEIFTAKRPTDEVFKDDLNLHNFVKEVLPDRAVDIVDPILLQQFESNVGGGGQNIFLQCLNSIFQLGVTCSDESPSQRMKMSDVAAELCLIRNKLPSVTANQI